MTAIVKDLYPLSKKVIWRFVRVFVVAFLGAIPAIRPDDLGGWLKLAILAGIAGGLEAIAKLFREKADYDSLIHKLPL